MLNSLFAPKIEAALAFRESLGRSVINHRFFLKNFDEFCFANYPNESELIKDIAWDFVYSPTFVSKGAATHRLRAIRFLGQYLTATGEPAYVFPDSTASLKHKFSPHVFTDDELQRFFAATDIFPYFSRAPLRHKIVPVIFRLIYTCGLRPKEGRELKCENINLDTGEILITNTKFDKERIVVMSDDMLSLCRDYDLYRKNIYKSQSEYFFPTKTGECYDKQQVTNWFKECWQSANPDISATELPSVRIYDLRHRFASTILNRWTDEKRDLYAMLPYLRAYMGYCDLSATEQYIHLLPENLMRSTGINWAGLESLIPEVAQ